jgi:oligoribonuclease NrnB/cAMP/cGMP phosphodiesterase (DHH superfamily)
MSHTDLDGYGCQLISKKIFPDGSFYNANYGLEVKATLDIIVEKLKDLSNTFVLISDLNLTLSEAKKIDSMVNKRNENGANIKLQLLDHHGSGQDCADKYDWYYLDTTRCATKIVYDYFLENFDEFKSRCEENFEKLIDSINAVDIWLEDNANFEFGKVCMTMVSKAHEINSNLFPDENRAYRLHLLSKTMDYIQEEDSHILLDEAVYFLKKEYLNIDGKNDTTDNLSSKRLVSMLESTKESLTVMCGDKKGLLTYCLGNVSIPANKFLKENPDYHFFMDVSRRGRSSLRANNEINVAKLASKIGNGGGHPNAAGLSFDDWKETIEYSKVKQFVQDKLNSLS